MENKIDESKLTNQNVVLKEYEQVLITYRENIKVLGQVLQFFVLGNITICVFAFQYKNFYIFLAGSILMYVLSRANHRAVQITLPIVIRGLIIENELGIVGLMNYTVIKIDSFEKFNSILNESKLYEPIEDQQERFKRVRLILDNLNNITLKFDFPFALSKYAAYLVIVLAIVQLLIFLLAILNNIYHFPFMTTLSKE
jgi:hypothetical protein